MLLAGCYSASAEGTCFDLGGTPALTFEVLGVIAPPDAGAVVSDDGASAAVADPSCGFGDVNVGDTFTVSVRKVRRTGCAQLECTTPYLNQGTRQPPGRLSYLGLPADRDGDSFGSELEHLACEPPSQVIALAPQCEAVRTMRVSLRTPPRGADEGTVAAGNEDFSLTRSLGMNADPELRCPNPEAAFPQGAYPGAGSSFWCVDHFGLRVIAVEH